MCEIKQDLPSTKNCISCIHWAPLFTGEEWGVRSFADAPSDIQTHITELLVRQFNIDGFIDLESDVLINKVTISEEDVTRGANDIPGNPDWPYWGECSRTNMNGENASTSLARAIDGAMYRAILRCRCNFGCVQWEIIR